MKFTYTTGQELTINKLNRGGDGSGGERTGWEGRDIPNTLLHCNGRSYIVFPKINLPTKLLNLADQIVVAKALKTLHVRMLNFFISSTVQYLW